MRHERTKLDGQVEHIYSYELTLSFRRQNYVIMFAWYLFNAKEFRHCECPKIIRCFSCLGLL